jgi:hypothetical protein
LSARAEGRSCPNGFSTTMRAPSEQPRAGQVVDDGREELRRNREIVKRPESVSELAAQRGERGRVSVVAVDVAEQGGEPGEDGLVDRSVSEDAVAGSGL